MTLTNYSQRHLDPELAAAYASKFERSLGRRLSARREAKLVCRAVTAGLAWLAQQGVSTSSVTLLDCPCGAGRFAAIAAARVAAYIASDHSPHMIELAKAALQRAGLGPRLLTTVQGDARDLPMADAKATMALSMRLLHHFAGQQDRIQVLRELRRVTQGPLVTSFLDAGSWKQRWHLARAARSGRASKRVLLSVADFAVEADLAGWQVRDSWQLSSLYSGLRVVLCVPTAGLPQTQGDEVQSQEHA